MEPHSPPPGPAAGSPCTHSLNCPVSGGGDLPFGGVGPSGLTQQVSQWTLGCLLRVDLRY